MSLFGAERGRNRELDFGRIWDAYEKQTKVLLLSDMPELEGLSAAEYTRNVDKHKYERRVSEFTVRLYATKQPETGAIGRVRPYVSVVTGDEFRQTVGKQWDEIPAQPYFVWDKTCTRQKFGLIFSEDLQEDNQIDSSLMFVAFAKNVPVCVASVLLKEGNDGQSIFYVETIASKYRHAGSATMKVMEIVARSWWRENFKLFSTNSVIAYTQEECETLKDKRYTSLNTFYKKQGLHDTDNACSSEWAANVVPEGVVEAPLQRVPNHMSKCLTPYPHVDVLDAADAASIYRTWFSNHVGPRPDWMKLLALRGIELYGTARRNDIVR